MADTQRAILEDEYGKASPEILEEIEELSAIPVEHQLRLLWLAVISIFSAGPPPE